MAEGPSEAPPTPTLRLQLVLDRLVALDEGR
jgi:hypothetical protein